MEGNFDSIEGDTALWALPPADPAQPNGGEAAGAGSVAFSAKERRAKS